MKTLRFYKYVPKPGTIMDDCTPGIFFEFWAPFTNDFRDIWKKEMAILTQEMYVLPNSKYAHAQICFYIFSMLKAKKIQQKSQNDKNSTKAKNKTSGLSNLKERLRRNNQS